jgi:hypothetical protein
MRHDPTLPIKIDSTSNGEFAPVPVGGVLERAKRLAAARITDQARRTGQSRREFLASVCGAATTLLTLNEAFAWRGHRGGSFELPREAAFEPAAAAQTLDGRQFIFDIQTHMVEPDGAWRRARPNAMSWLAQTPQGRCGEADSLRCFDAHHFVKEIFPVAGSCCTPWSCPTPMFRRASSSAWWTRIGPTAFRPGRSIRSGDRRRWAGGSTIRASACRSSSRRAGLA